MKSSLIMHFSVDKENKKINVEREFAAPVEKVWAAWTESQWLDQWWAPHPWKARTKVMDFREGGYWLYAMVGPDATEIWSRADFKNISPLKSYSCLAGFCDAEGNINHSFPRSLWTNVFRKMPDSTIVYIEKQYDNLEDLEKVMEMGFKEGFTAGMENLDRLIDAGRI